MAKDRQLVAKDEQLVAPAKELGKLREQLSLQPPPMEGMAPEDTETDSLYTTLCYQLTADEWSDSCDVHEVIHLIHAGTIADEMLVLPVGANDSAPFEDVKHQFDWPTNDDAAPPTASKWCKVRQRHALGQIVQQELHVNLECIDLTVDRRCATT